MTNPIDLLETTEHPEKLRRVVIDPVTRVEGHGKVTLLLDENNRIKQARLHIVEFRGFEKFIQGRPYWELPVLVQRLCGICPVSHNLAASKAIDQIVGVDELSATAEKIRRLMHLGQILQSHALHFFHLSSPDLLFGYDDEVAHRNIVGVIADHPDIARQGILLRKYGQEIIRVISGKRVHGTGPTPGGVNKSLSLNERQFLLTDINQIITWSHGALNLAKKIFLDNIEANRNFAYIETNMLSLIRQDGALDLYHGGLRAKSIDDRILFDHFDYRNYNDMIGEQIKTWSYMKFPYFRSLGHDEGSYRVGPLARINNCDFITTPLAEAERQIFREFVDHGLVQSTLAYHWARMIELVHCAEEIKQLLNDPDITGRDLKREGTLRSEGIGVIEAPRGTLFHHYQINDDGLVTKANLIVSTTNNNRAMNQSIRKVANDIFDGREISESLLNHIEVAIRAYDPCLSCATHALGKMPLVVELFNAQGELTHSLQKESNGSISKPGHDG